MYNARITGTTFIDMLEPLVNIEFHCMEKSCMHIYKKYLLLCSTEERKQVIAYIASFLHSCRDVFLAGGNANSNARHNDPKAQFLLIKVSFICLI